MEVILAKTAGFCFGVKRAVDTAYAEAGKQHVYTYGPIIHNDEVTGDLAKHGVTIIDEADLAALHEGSVIIRSHGVAKSVYDSISAQGLTVIDATCPFVKKIHNICYEETGKGNSAIIVGNPNHPEVCGIVGWCQRAPIVISSAEDAERLPLSDRDSYFVVSQTTFHTTKFKQILDILERKGYNLNVYSTICNATHERQDETRELARQVDAMIVIGDMNSSNTQKLYEISKEACMNTYYVQTLVDLDLAALESVNRVGITAGASTPNNIIKEVLIACQR